MTMVFLAGGNVGPELLPLLQLVYNMIIFPSDDSMELENTESDESVKDSQSSVSTKPRQKASVNQFLLPTYRLFEEKDDKDEEKKIKENSTRKGMRLNFRKIARAITKQRKMNMLLQDIAHQGDNQTKAEGFVTRTEDGKERLTFNVNAFRAYVQSCGVIPEEIKRILLKQSWNRTKEEVEQVLRIVRRMKGFNQYSMYVKRELAKVLYYAKYKANRVIIRQGHIGMSFYFIASGSVVVERIEEDRVTGERHTQTVGEMIAGDSFGELALLHDIRRAATIICKETSEFLTVDKEDFNEVLRMSHQIEYERKMSILTTHPAFSTWTPSEIKQTVPHTKLHNYQPNTVILGGKETNPDFAYFIINGRCNVVREMTVVKHCLPSGKARFTLPPINNAKPGILNAARASNKKRIVERKLLVIRVLNKGDYFGVGEDLSTTFIVTTGKVHCVLINHIVLLKRDRGKCMEDMRQKLMETFPTQQQAFDGFVQDFIWKQYKRKCIDDVISKCKKSNCTSYEDVPLVVRREHSHYFD